MKEIEIACIITLIALSLNLFFALSLAFLRLLPMPKKLAAEPDSDARRAAFAAFAANWASLIHAVVIIGWGGWIYAAYGIREPGPDLFLESAFISFSLGYFVSDMLFGLIYHSNDSLMTFHHVLVCITVIYVLWRREYASWGMASLVVAEVSNPFNLLRLNFAQIEGLEKLSQACAYLFAATFIFFRFANKRLRGLVPAHVHARQ